MIRRSTKSELTERNRTPVMTTGEPCLAPTCFCELFERVDMYRIADFYWEYELHGAKSSHKKVYKRVKPCLLAGRGVIHDHMNLASNGHMPESALLAAVILAAYKDLSNPSPTIREEALAWFTAPHHGLDLAVGGISFLFACDALGLEPVALIRAAHQLAAKRARMAQEEELCLALPQG